MEKKIVTVKDVVKQVGVLSGESQRVVRNVLDALGRVAAQDLSEAGSELAVEVKIFPGMSLKSDYIESREARNPRTGETIMTAPRIRVKGHFAPSFKSAVNGSDIDD